jgi:selT/selW/selH-like putative selenoprotein
MQARGVETDIVPGRVGQFDVEVDGKLVFSKYQEDRFPDADELLRLLPP